MRLQQYILKYFLVLTLIPLKQNFMIHNLDIEILLIYKSLVLYMMFLISQAKKMPITDFKLTNIVQAPLISR